MYIITSATDDYTSTFIISSATSLSLSLYMSIYLPTYPPISLIYGLQLHLGMPVLSTSALDSSVSLHAPAEVETA